jgi:hypothetical protein
MRDIMDGVINSAEGSNGGVELLDNRIKVNLYKRSLLGFDKNKSKIIEIAFADITDISITGLGPLGGQFDIKSIKENASISFGSKEKSNFENVLAMASQKASQIGQMPPKAAKSNVEYEARLKEIKDQITRIGNNSLSMCKKEIMELPKILQADEVIEQIVSGSYEGGHGVLVATNKRLVFVDKGTLWGCKVEDFPYDKINSIQYDTGMLMGTIKIHASGNHADIHNVDKVWAKNFADFARAKISSYTNVPTQSPQLAVDMLSQLERLAKLKEQGVLTDEEFSEQKAKMLGKL